jgi:hypothetical protein
MRMAFRTKVSKMHTILEGAEGGQVEVERRLRLRDPFLHHLHPHHCQISAVRMNY